MSIAFQNAVTGDAGEFSVGTTNGEAQTNPGSKGAIITVDFSSITGTSPSLNLLLEWSPDGGDTWFQYAVTLSRTGSSTTTPSVFIVYPCTGASIIHTDTTTEVVNAPLPQTWRLVYVVSGSDSVFTISNVFVNYL